MSLSPILSIVLSITLVAAALAADRHPGNRYTFPDAAFIQQGGRLIDLTNPPPETGIIAAVGDGVTDDTAAFVSAFDFLMAQIGLPGEPYSLTDAGGEAFAQILYLPDGEYLVSDTLSYSGPLRYNEDGVINTTNGAQPNFTAEAFAKIRIFGQSREGVVIRLTDDAPGFNQPSAPKPILAFGKGNSNNSVSYNSLRNVTIINGEGNPGAVGIDWSGANNSHMSNISIRSVDGGGFSGFRFKINATMGYHRDLSVEGFDYGIYMEPYHMMQNTFEYLTLEGQNVAGIVSHYSMASIRRLTSRNAAPAIRMVENGSHIVLLDSELFGLDETSHSAIELEDGKGHLFARNVAVFDYPASVKKGSTVELTGKIEEYASGAVSTFDEATPPLSLNLPIKESPIVQWPEDPEAWANVDTFPGQTDSERIQNALNSGLPVVFFPRGSYEIDETVSIPPHVQSLVMAYTRFNGGGFAFEINEPSPLLLQLIDYSGHGGARLIRQNAPRPLLLENTGTNSALYESALPEGAVSELYLNGCNGVGKNPNSLSQLRIWARFINTEFKGGPNFTPINSLMWVLGYKVEGPTVNFLNSKGSALEVLGGTANFAGGGSDEYAAFDSAGSAFFENYGGQMSLVFGTNTRNTSLGANRLIHSIQGGIAREWDQAHFPRRTRDVQTRELKSVIVPLFADYRPGALATLVNHIRGTPASPITIEETDSRVSRSGLWWTVPHSAASEGGFLTAEASSTNKATVQPAVSGEFIIQIKAVGTWGRASDRAAITIEHAFGRQNVAVDQTTEGWQTLGTGAFTLNPDSQIHISGDVRQRGTSREERIALDAIRLIPLRKSNETTLPGTYFEAEYPQAPILP